MVRGLKIIPYKHNWGNRVFGSQRNRHMRRFNRFSYFWKIIIRLFYAYFIYVYAYALYVVQKVVLVWTLEVIGSRVRYLWGSKKPVTSRIAWTMRSPFWQVLYALSLVWEQSLVEHFAQILLAILCSGKFEDDLLSLSPEYFVISWKISHVSPESADKGLNYWSISPFTVSSIGVSSVWSYSVVMATVLAQTLHLCCCLFICAFSEYFIMLLLCPRHCFREWE